MYHKQLFLADAIRLRDKISAVMPRWYRAMPSLEGEFEYGFTMYENARQSALGMLVLGSEALRTDNKLLVNLGVTAVTTVAPAASAIATAGSAASTTQGAVLNEQYWWPFFNDCWVMGGVHGRQQFHLASVDWPPNTDLWDRRNRRPTMLGRELLILSISGYVLRRTPGLGMVFYNDDHMKAFGLRLANIYALDPGDDEAAFVARIKAAF
ncbi:MAG: hypothetical protein JO218_03890 [Burkholderiales bacterium]|nr:hypothetical protein [Burkholderiales bacterium]